MAGRWQAGLRPKWDFHAMNLKTKTLEVLIDISNLYLAEIKDSGKQIYTSGHHKSTRYLMASLLINPFSMDIFGWTR